MLVGSLRMIRDWLFFSFKMGDKYEKIFYIDNVVYVNALFCFLL